MTNHAVDTDRGHFDDSGPPEPATAEPAKTATPGGAGRLAAIDLVRALALYGMFVINTGAQGDWMSNGVPAWLAEIPHGRSSSTFALLAGLSLALITGGRTVKTGRGRRQAMVKIAIRAVILMALGTAMVAAGTSIPLILVSYGLFFLLALPFAKLGFRGLAIAAAVVALLGPIARNYTRVLQEGGWREGYLDFDPIIQLGRLFDAMFGGVLISGVEWEDWGMLPLDGYELPALLTYGSLYPAVVFMAYILAGMAIGRLDLASRLVRIRMAVAGPVLMLAGYGTAALLALAGTGVQAPFLIGLDADEAFGDEEVMKLSDEEFAALESGEMSEEEFFADAESKELGGTSMEAVQGVSGVFNGASHSGGILEVLGNIGFSITLIVLFMVLLERLKWLRVVLTPLIAVGGMTLTAYVIQGVAIAMLPGFGSVEVDTLGEDRPDGSIWEPVTAAQMLLWLMIVTTLVAFVWSRFFKRGPLEYLVYSAGKLGRFAK